MATAALRSEQPVINPWLIAVAVMLGTFMEVLDTTVMNVSLSHMAGSLGATVDEATWVLTSYLVANAIVLPMTGWLANRFGRKRLLMLSMGGFTLASVLCGLAPNLPLLLLFRVIQGATGGGLQPLSQAIMLEAFPPEKRGKAMAFWGLGIVVAPMLGPVLGGWLTDSYSWRWLFYINLPIGALGLLLSKWFVFDPHYLKKQRGSVDYWGIGLLAVGMGALQIMLDKGQEDDWFGSNFIIVLCILAVAGLGAFIINEFLRAHPIVNLRIFRVRTYTTGVFLMTTLGFVLYGSMVLLPIFLQSLLGYSALDSGVAMLPRGLGSFIAMPVVGILMSKIEPRKLLWVGMLVAALSLWDLSMINLNAGYWDIFWPQLIQGMSMGFIFVPLTTVTHDPIPKEQMGNATSIFNVMRNIGGSIGIAGVTTIVARKTQSNINILGSHVTPYTQAAQELMKSAAGLFISKGGAPGPVGASGAASQAYASMFGMVAKQAAMLANIHAFRLLAIMFAVVTPLILLMRKPRHHGGGEVAAH
jgi:DHA2 family multidrug resistance protein